MKRIAVIAACGAWSVALADQGPAEPRVRPIAAPPSTSICIIENPEVRPEFLEGYRADLLAKGLNVAVLKKPDRFYDCPMISTYIAFWSKDVYTGFGSIIDYAKLSVYRNGQLLGYATFKRSSAYVMTKADTQLKGLVDELFPQP